MSHLAERLAEFVYEELTALEMEEARQHVAQCLECQGRVSEFQKVQHALETVPDVEVPRRVVFVESRKSVTRTWVPLRWLVPSATAAALVLALVIGGPIQFRPTRIGHDDRVWCVTRSRAFTGGCPTCRCRAATGGLRADRSARHL